MWPRFLKEIRAKHTAQAEARRLYADLVDAVPEVMDKRRLMVVRDGPLHLIPFDALMDSTGHYLVDSRIVTYEPSASSFFLLRSAHHQQAVAQGVVLQLLESDWYPAMNATQPTDTVQGTTFRRRDHRPLCPLVSPLRAQFPEPGRDDGRAQPECRPRHHLALGAALCTRTESALSPGTAQDQRLVESGRDLSSGRWQVDLFVSGGGFDGRHD